MAKARGAVGGDKGKAAQVKKALAAKGRKKGAATSASSLLEDVTGTTLVLVFVVCALSSFLFFQWKLKQSASVAFVNPYESVSLSAERAAAKELVKRSGGNGQFSNFSSQQETDKRLALARKHWENGEYDLALEQIEILETLGWVSPGVLNNKGVIAWDAKQFYLAFITFCDALDRSTVGPLQDVINNMIGMWSESGFTFSDTVARDRVAKHLMAAVKQLVDWSTKEKFQACRFMFRNGANDMSVECYRYLFKTVPSDIPMVIDIMHNLGMAMVFQDDPEGMTWLRKSQLGFTRTWPFFEDRRPLGEEVDNIVMLHPHTEHPAMQMSELDTSSRNFGLVPGQYYGDNRPVPAELSGALGMPPFSIALPERPITMIEMHDVLFEEPGVFHKDREILLYDLGVFQFLSSWKSATAEGEVELTRVEEDVVIFIGAWSGNYYHFIVESLSRIALAMEYGTLEKYPTAKFLIVIPKERPAPPAFVTESLQMLNVPEDRLLFMHVGQEQVLAHTLLYACFGFFEGIETAKAIHTQIPTAIAIRTLRERLVPAHLRMPKSQRNKVVYVSRADQANRRTLFDESLIPTLRNLVGDDRLVVHGDRKMTVSEQRDLFSEAILVVGGHGAGLANLIFCEPGTGVLEFPTETRYQQLYYSALSSAIGLRFFQVPAITAIYYGPYFNGEGAVLTVAHAVHDALQVLEHGL